MMKKLTYVFLLLLTGRLCGQSPAISPQVINSAGDHRQAGSTGVWITDNVGEPFTETFAPAAGTLQITQGFIQPMAISATFTADIIRRGISCTDKEDGGISIAINSVYKQHTETFFWYPSSACPAKNCSNALDNLKAGTYSVMIVSTYTNNVGAQRTDTVRRTKIDIEDSPLPCRITIFTGFTPNSDGINDTWRIDNISEFPKNKVTVFNRWGILLAEINGYDNDTKYFPAKELADKLVGSTYFYVIDLGDGSKPYKGWFELIKN